MRVIRDLLIGHPPLCPFPSAKICSTVTSGQAATGARQLCLRPQTFSTVFLDFWLDRRRRSLWLACTMASRATGSGSSAAPSATSSACSRALRAWRSSASARGSAPAAPRPAGGSSAGPRLFPARPRPSSCRRGGSPSPGSGPGPPASPRLPRAPRQSASATARAAHSAAAASARTSAASSAPPSAPPRGADSASAASDSAAAR